MASFSTRRDFLQHSSRCYYCCTHGARHGHHGCLILVLTSSLSPVKFFWTCSWTPDNCGCCPIHALNLGPRTPPSTMLTAALHDCLPRGPPSRVVDHQQFWPSRHPRSSSLRLPARCFRLHRLSIALHQSQLYFKPKSRTQHMSFTSSSTTNPNPNPA